MHKFYLISLFLFSPLAAMLNPAIPSSDGICHLARVPREIRDRIAKFVLYETDEEFVARAIADYRKQKDKPQRPQVPGVPPLSSPKFSPTKTYLAYFIRTIYDSARINIVGPVYGEKTSEHPNPIASYQHTYTTSPMTSNPRYISFNKQRTKILVVNIHEIRCLHSLPDFFIEEKFTGSCAENSLKEFFLRKLVCKRIESSLARRPS